MKLIIFLSAIVSINISAQHNFFNSSMPYDTTWQWINPLPQGNNLNNIFFISQNTGFAAGDKGTILKTTNGGLDWKVTLDNIKGNFKSITFLNSGEGYAAGELSGLYFTSDGGENWINKGITDIAEKVLFPFKDTGFIVDNYSGDIEALSQGLLRKTTDNGKTWNLIYSDVNSQLTDLFFIDNTGYLISGIQSSALSKTTDQGLNWTKVYGFPRSFNGGWLLINKIYFPGQNNGIAIGTQGYIAKTNDSGAHWQVVISQTNRSLKNLAFWDSTTGLIAGDNGTILKTINGGQSWIKINPGTDKNLSSVCCISNGLAFIAGEGGIILRSTDFGLTWNNVIKSITSAGLKSITTTDNNFIAVGEKGTILKISNELSLDLIDSPVKTTLNSISFANSKQGIAVGDSGVIIITSSGGYNWEVKESNTKLNLYGISLSDNGTGIAVGEKGVIIRTADFGNSWDSINSGTIEDLYSVILADNYTGYASGNILLKTINSGLNWSPVYFNLFNINSCKNCHAISFLNKDTGYIVMPVIGGYSWITGIIKTIDGGLSWNYYGFGNFYTLFYRKVDTYTISILNDSSIIAAGDYGFIFKTTDFGSSWHWEGSPNYNSLYSISSSANSDKVLITGNNGTILYKSFLPVDIKEKALLPGKFTLFQNYPNPFNPTTTIEYEIPEDTQVNISLFDITGRRIKTLVNKEQTAGVYRIELNASGLASGSYFYKMRTRKYEVTKTLTIIK